MKKTRILIFISVLAFILMGVGYAYWMDQLTINNTVSTGELNVEFVEELGHPYIYALTGEEDAKYLELSKTHGSKSTRFVIDKMYPGTAVTYEAEIANLGTIPAKVKAVKVEFSDSSSELLKSTVVVSGYWFGDDYVELGDFTNPVKLGGLETELNSKLAGLEIGMINNTDFSLEFSLPYDAGNDLEKQRAEFDVTFRFTQFNE